MGRTLWVATIEAMATGTPVLGTPRGAAPEIVLDGVTGFIRDTPLAMAAGLSECATLTRADCRRSTETTFSARRMVREHVWSSMNNAWPGNLAPLMFRSGGSSGSGSRAASWGITDATPPGRPGRLREYARQAAIAHENQPCCLP
ncbi:glycosyltransferase [Paeniglutamicibacter sp.]|uniref:glycosyltransferase n=1 Tax=Paeniglutamicibacter sp. TaxID=1934391 RepID=UPI00398991AF